MTMLGVRNHEAVVEPPEGVTAGESVPTESEPDEFERAVVDEMVAILKTHEAFHGKSDAELRDIAYEKLQETH